MEMYMETLHVFVLSCLNLHESTKHACFHVFSPFSASFYEQGLSEIGV